MIPGIRLPFSAAAWFGRNESAPSRRPEREALALGAIHDSTDADLRITTDEGDTVTISAHREIDATFASYQSGGARRDGAAVAALSVDQQFDVTIEGDLNAEEKRDVGRLVQQLKRVISRFLRGDQGNLGLERLRFGNLESIARFDLTVEHSQSVTLAGRTGHTVPATGSGEVGGEPANLPAAETGEGFVRRSPTDPSVIADGNAGEILPLAETQTLAEQAVAKAHALQLPPGAMKKLFPPAFRQLLRDVPNQPEFSMLRQMIEDLHHDLMQRLRNADGERGRRSEHDERHAHD